MKRRKITAGKLSKILKEHERWIDTDEEEGKRADLSNANLTSADLSEVLGLNIEQLSEVETLYKAELDPELKKQVKDEYPHLLEKPEEE
jgi:hypothetical protein